MAGLLVMMVAAQVATALQPAGAWGLETGPTGCRISRTYAGAPGVELGFETHLTSSNISMMFIAPRRALPEGTGDIRLVAAPEPAVDVHYGAFQTPDPAMRLIKMFPDRPMLDAIAAAKSIEIGKQPIALSTIGMRAALKALDDCTAQLLTSWGADPTLYRQGKLAKLVGGAGGWFTNADYKRVVKSRHVDGPIVLLVTTAADGTPSACKAIDGQDPEIGAGTCEIALRRGRFEPPRDAAGKPMASYTVLPVRWIAP